MVFQNYALYPHMSVRENIAFPLACSGVPKAEAKSRVERAAEILGLGEYLHRRPKALSGGQRQRVAMGRAIVRKPQAFLMDEPLSNLDAKLRGQMRAEIRGLQRQFETTTLYVTHDQVEAMTMGDRIAVMRKGLLQQLGTPDELYETPANLFVAEFIGSPPMNVVTATVLRSGAGPTSSSARSGSSCRPARWTPTRPSPAADETTVALGIRPESLRDPATSDSRWLRLVADVELVENVPPEKLVHLRIDAEPVVTEATVEIAKDIDEAAVEDLRVLGKGTVLNARLPGSATVREGTRAEFAVPPSALHFFDLSTGQAIAPTAAAPRRRRPPDRDEDLVTTPAHHIKRGVSLYSFQEEYFLRTLTLEQCIAAAASFGARGIEIIPEQSIPGFPNLTDEFVDTWFSWMEQYGTTPVATDLFLDTKLYPHRWLTLEEQVDSVHRDIDIAVRLGAKVVRAIINTPPEVMEGAAPYAEEQGVRLLLEVHAPFHYEHPWILQHLEVMDRTGSPALGFMPDMGTYVRRFPRVVSERALRDGARPELVDLIVKTYDDQRRHPRPDGHRQLPQRRAGRHRPGPAGDALHLDRAQAHARPHGPASGTSRRSSTR